MLFRSDIIFSNCSKLWGEVFPDVHDDVYEIVKGLRHSDGQRYVRPNYAGVGLEQGVGVGQVRVQWCGGGQGGSMQISDAES